MSTVVADIGNNIKKRQRDKKEGRKEGRNGRGGGRKKNTLGNNHNQIRYADDPLDLDRAVTATTWKQPENYPKTCPI